MRSLMKTVLSKTPVRGTDRLRQTIGALGKLLQQTINDLQALESELQQHHGSNPETEQLRRAAAEWETERARLLATMEQTKSEYDRTMAEADEAAAIALERQIATAVDRMRAEMKAQWDAERAELTPENRQARDEAVAAEAARVEGLIRGINLLIENPDTELSVVIRKNAERAELESYLKGLRFRVPDPRGS
jgi:Sec-independent protein translocase protein TatA